MSKGQRSSFLRCEQFAAGSDEGFLLGRGQGEGGDDLAREFGEGEVVGGGKLALPLSGSEDVPALGGDPVDARHVGRGDEVVEFENSG